MDQPETRDTSKCASRSISYYTITDYNYKTIIILYYPRSISSSPRLKRFNQWLKEHSAKADFQQWTESFAALLCQESSPAEKKEKEDDPIPLQEEDPGDASICAPGDGTYLSACQVQ